MVMVAVEGLGAGCAAGLAEHADIATTSRPKIRVCLFTMENRRCDLRL
jgi:hypothetical protein